MGAELGHSEPQQSGLLPSQAGCAGGPRPKSKETRVWLLQWFHTLHIPPENMIVSRWSLTDSLWVNAKVGMAATC